jgi:hypothetical protein
MVVDSLGFDIGHPIDEDILNRPGFSGDIIS